MTNAAPQVISPPKGTLVEPLSLNLGGAGEGHLDGRIQGFKTVDLRPGPNTDIVANVKDLSFCGDGAVEDIYSSNVLEHFSHMETPSVLKEWFRVLRPGGTLYLSVPDFEACVRLYNKIGLVTWVQYLIWGDQAHPLNYHYINFTCATLSKLLNDTGFSDIKRVKHFTFCVKDASEHRDNIMGEQISLNMEATK